MVIQISRRLMQAEVWRFVGFVSSVVGLLCYALSSSLNHLIGEWNWLKIFLYSVFSFVICLLILFAKAGQHSRSLLFKAHLAVLVLTVTSVYSFYYDKTVNGKPDTYHLISYAAFAVMSLSLSRQTHCGFEVDLLYFFLGCLIVQLMKISLSLTIVGVGISYCLIILRSSLDSQSADTGGASLSDHVVIQLDSPQANTGTGTAGFRAATQLVPLQRALELVQQDDPELRVEAARDIRRLTKTSLRNRRLLAQAVSPLVSMLRVDSPEFESREAALLALLNLAVKDEKNKINIVEAGALEPIVSFLKSQNENMREYATASLLTLSASTTNKPIISACGAIPFLVEILREGSPQAKADAVMALSNLSTLPDNLSIILESNPIPFIVDLLKTSKISSKIAEKCCALVESLVGYDEGRTALASVDGGVLAVVEVLENGSLQSREHAVGALLTMCQSDPSKYREPILREGIIPGLLELTVQEKPKSQLQARALLQLIRESPYPRSEIEPDTLDS